MFIMDKSVQNKRSGFGKILPDVLSCQVSENLDAFIAAAAESSISIPDTFISDTFLNRIWAFSEFISRNCIHNPAPAVELLETGDLGRAYGSDEFQNRVSNALSGITDEQELGSALRLLRQREMIRIAWRDLAGKADLMEVISDLSAFADACIDGALTLLHKWQTHEIGTPYSEDGIPQRLVVIGMGKLGARELNFSSDVDLIFTFPESGETQGGPRSVSNDEFFTRLARRLIKALGAKTAEGFVFRVDTNLRPYGESGALVMSFDAMEDYYESQGREWERYAWIKARIVAGDITAGNHLLSRLRPFVFRRYLDFTVFESLRNMKGLIEREVMRKGMASNVKLGPGGIREVEFIGQTFQLLRGGGIRELRARPILRILELLPQHDLLSVDDCSKLKKAYIFLRTVEHRLQEYADQQTHDLPKERVDRTRLALSMGYSEWKSFNRQLNILMKRVHSIFQQIFSHPRQETGEKSVLSGLTAFWGGGMDQEQGLKLFNDMGLENPEETVRMVNQFRDSHAVLALNYHSRERLDRLVPLLLSEVGNSTQTALTVQRLLHIIESIQRRTCYLALLEENPAVLSRLTRLCSESSWIATLLARHPILLDELIGSRPLDAKPDRDELRDELRMRMERISPDDLEQQMDELRAFKLARTMRVAVADLADSLPLMKVSDHLTEIAEIVLSEVLDLAWAHLGERHGWPLCTISGTGCDKGFAVAAYGKLGGIELGYGSDLDLVFLHAGDSGDMTDGKKPVFNPHFFIRMGQRIIHILTANTISGVLYPVDMRLRPSGESGVLVSHVDGFAEYQSTDARIWEHQSLIRARIVAGDPLVGRRFDKVRKEILTRFHDPDMLLNEVRSMRERMRTELAEKDSNSFDLKQDPGGIVDIEFMVQYQVLAGAHKYPEILRWTDNIRLLEDIEKAGLMSKIQVSLLKEAFLTYRRRVHKLNLNEQPAIIEKNEFKALRLEVVRIWQDVIGG